MRIRLLTQDDKAQALALWKVSFDYDPPAFADWYFENRYLPQWSVGVFDGDKLISMIHGTPMTLSLGEGSFPALMTSGVATVSEEQGKGHMHEAMLFLRACAAEKGIRALFNHPQRQGAYAHLGFRSCAFTQYWRGEGTHRAGDIAPFSEEEAFRIYTALSDRYAGFVRRDRDGFRLKMADYASVGGRGFLVEEAGRTVGYCMYFDGEDLWAEEVLSLAGYGSILHELQRLAAGRAVCAKLPPDADGEGETLPQNVMLAPEDIWQAMERAGRPWFCVDEY